MSHVGIKRINDATGEVEAFAEVRNAMAGALWIWMTLDQAYGHRFSMLSPACWRLANAGAMSDRDCLVCGWTFDGAYILREHLPALADALEQFFAEHGADIAPTIPGVAAALRQLAGDPAARGACFHQTSVTDNPWWLPGRSGDCDDEGSPFAFGLDTKDANGREPFEVFADFGPEGLRAKRAAAAAQEGMSR